MSKTISKKYEWTEEQKHFIRTKHNNPLDGTMYWHSFIDKFNIEDTDKVIDRKDKNLDKEDEKLYGDLQLTRHTRCAIENLPRIKIGQMYVLESFKNHKTMTNEQVVYVREVSNHSNNHYPIYPEDEQPIDGMMDFFMKKCEEKEKENEKKKKENEEENKKKEKPKYQYNIYFPLDMKLNKYDSDGLSKFGSNGSLIAMKGDTWSHMDCYTDEPFEIVDDYFCSPNTQSNCQLIKCKTIDTPSSKYVKYYNYIVTYPNIDVLNAYDKRGLKKFGIDYDGSVDKFDGDDFKYASITSLKCPSVIDKYFNSPKSDSVDVENIDCD